MRGGERRGGSCSESVYLLVARQVFVEGHAGVLVCYARVSAGGYPVLPERHCPVVCMRCGCSRVLLLCALVVSEAPSVELFRVCCRRLFWRTVAGVIRSGCCRFGRLRGQRGSVASSSCQPEYIQGVN